MTRSLSVSETGLRLIKAFEGFRPVDRELVTGARVVGYGHRVFSQTPIRMTEEQAEETLLLDLEAYEELINEEVHAPLTQSQFDALVSLAFNIGPKAFRGSDILRAINNGRPLDAAAGFDVWRKATIDGKTFVVDALMRRRTAEKSLFLRTEAIIPAPSALLEPKADYDTGLGPIEDGLPVFTEDDAIGIIARATYEATPDPAFDEDEEVDVDEDDDVLTLSADMEAEIEPEADPEPEPEPEEDPFEFSDLASLMAVTTAEPELASDDEDALVVDDEDGDDDEDEGDDDDDDEDDGSALAADSAESEGELDDEEDELEVAARTIDETVEETLTESPISEAADSLGERLSALLDSDAEETVTETVDLPESLIEAPSDDKRSNLVTFPSRQLVDPEPVDPGDPDGLAFNDGEAVAEDAPNNSVTNPIVIDNLAADDVIRASGDSKDVIYDPEGDPVEAATRYLERAGVAMDEDKAGGGMWIPLALGAILIGVSAVLLGRGATSLLNAWGPASVIAAAVTGGLMILFTLYAAARGRFA